MTLPVIGSGLGKGVGASWRGLERELALGLTEWPCAVLTALITPTDPNGSISSSRGWFLFGRGGAWLQVLTWAGWSLASGPNLSIGDPVTVLAPLIMTMDLHGPVSGS